MFEINNIVAQSTAKGSSPISGAVDGDPGLWLLCLMWISTKIGYFPDLLQEFSVVLVFKKTSSAQRTGRNDLLAARFPRPVMIRISSTTRCYGFLDDELDGRFVHYGQHLPGCALVAGKKRVPSPAAGIIAFLPSYSITPFSGIAMIKGLI